MSQGSMERQLSCSTVIRTHPLMNSCHKNGDGKRVMGGLYY
uniref:Uncharacterized protein n=1 Tax=Anguilla anguilla TaxID=7936 RepID=A0A0E9SNR3_ANGAN